MVRLHEVLKPPLPLSPPCPYHPSPLPLLPFYTYLQGNKVGVSGSADVVRLREVLNSPDAAKYKILEVNTPALEALHSVWKTFPPSVRG